MRLTKFTAFERSHCNYIAFKPKKRPKFKSVKYSYSNPLFSMPNWVVGITVAHHYNRVNDYVLLSWLISLCGWRLMAIATDTARCFSTPDERDWWWSIGKLSAHHSHPGTGYANTYLTLFLYFSPPHKPTLCSSHCNTHTHTHFLCVKRQGRDFVASEVMRPQLPHSLQCSKPTLPGQRFTLSKPCTPSHVYFIPRVSQCYPIISIPSIFSSSHCPFFLKITLSFVALIWNKLSRDCEDVSNQNKV